MHLLILDLKVQSSCTVLILREQWLRKVLFRVVKTTLSSGYNISGLVPVCWLLFQCF